MKEQTFSLIKPNAMKKNKVGAILNVFQEKGLEIVGLKMIHVSQELCEKFYEEHKERPFFGSLVEFITSSPVIVMVLSGENAISRVREIMGDTDPEKAQKGTLRFEYGDSLGENAVHGSDSVKSAQREISLFFSSEELFKMQ